MEANVAAPASNISQEEYEKQLSGKSTTGIFTDPTVRADFAQSFTRLNESDGKDNKGDIVAEQLSVEEVLPKFRGMIKDRFETDKEKGLPDARKWMFETVPLKLCPGKSLDDLFIGKCPS